MYQELIDKCRKAYKDKKIAVAYHYWEEIHELLSKKLDECGKDQNKRWKVYAEYHDNIMQIPLIAGNSQWDNQQLSFLTTEMSLKECSTTSREA